MTRKKFKQAKYRSGTKFVKEVTGDMCHVFKCMGDVYAMEMVDGVPFSLNNLSDVVRSQDHGCH